MPQISLYWFAAQEQTTILSSENCRYFYVKLSGETNALGVFF